MMEIVQDLRYGMRCLRRSPGFTLVAVLTLALGVGANTAVFSLINAVLLRPLPYPEPGRLVLVWESAPFFGLHDSPVAPANYVDWKARSRSFEEMGAIEDHSYRLTGGGAPEVVEGSGTTASALRALRIRPMIGRIFREEEDQPGAAKVALIGEGFWRRRFAADPHIAGKSVLLNDEKHTIVGVLAAGSEPPAEYSGAVGQIWTPLRSGYTVQEWADRGRHNWMVIARLRPGVPPAQADAEMKAIGAGLAREYPDTNAQVGAFVAPLREHFVGSTRRVLFLMLAAVACVLLIACSNLANLLLSRAAGRTKEVAVRAALGAGAWRLVCQFVCESLILCSAGGAAGLLLATTTFGFLARLAPGDMGCFQALSIDGRVLSFTLGLAVVTAVVFGLVPLLQVRRVNVSRSLKQSARTLAAAAGSSRLRAALVCAEVALAFVLLVGAGLLIATFIRLRAVDPGCRTHNLLTLRMPPPEKRHWPDQVLAYQDEVLRRVRALPGVASAAFTNHIPVAFKGDITGVGAEGRDPKERFQCNTRMIGPGYLATMGIPLRRGRDILETDRVGAPNVLLVNETLARMLWTDQNPLGRRVVFGTELQVPVIGVVGDIHQSGLDAPPQPELYISALQAGFPASSLAIHTKVAPAALEAAVRRAIWAADPDQPITDVATMEEILDRDVSGRRMQTMLLTAFAGMALLLAAVGLYGVLAYLVTRQIPEIGLRMALGADPAHVLRRIVLHGLQLAVAGTALGAAASLVLARLLVSELYGVKPAYTATYAAVSAVLLVTAALASYVPARRAMRVDPIVALRDE